MVFIPQLALCRLAASLRTTTTFILHFLKRQGDAAPPPPRDNGGGSPPPPRPAAPFDNHKGSCASRLHYRHLLSKPLCLKFFYLFSVSLFGFLLLLILDHNKLKAKHPYKPAIEPFHLFFMSASATTVSSIATIEMEDFTNSQLIVITILMFVGGEIFTSMIHLQFQSHTTATMNMITTTKAHVSKYFARFIPNTTTTTTTSSNDNTDNFDDLEDGLPQAAFGIVATDDREEMECTLRSFKCLGDIMVGYLVIINLLGSLVLLAYVTFAKKARKIIVEEKGLNLTIFSVFAVVSSFTNCGFLPTNENMIIFREHSFLCFLLMFLMLIGNTLFPPCLNLVVWALSKITNDVSEIRGFLDYDSWMKKCRRVGLDFEHLLPVKTSLFLMGSVFGFIGLQFVLYCVWEWNDLKGDLDVWSRVVDGLFQAVSIRHAGEAVFDLSSFSPAILMLFMVMMYLPPYALLSPADGRIGSREQLMINSRDEEKDHDHDIELMNNVNSSMKIINLATNTNDTSVYIEMSLVWFKAKEVLKSIMPGGPVVYLVLFVMIACITEREHMRKDPLNFNLLAIAFEITSTFGSVGLSMGYSCKRFFIFSSSSSNSGNNTSNVLLYNNCHEKTASLCSKWTREGQILILVIMFYARLKKLTTRCGKAWVNL